MTEPGAEVTVRFERDALDIAHAVRHAELAPFGPLTLGPDELESARWYTRAELKNSPENETFRLPRRDSIARRLIEDWLDEG